MPIALPVASRLPTADVFEALASGPEGLSGEEAARRLAADGPNSLASHKATAFGVLLRQLRNPLLILLIGAASVSVVTGDVGGGSIIAAIVVMSVGLGFFNEYRSERAVASLQTNIRHETQVTRNGVEQTIDVRSVVPGDVVTLRLGALVPADVRLIEVNKLECDEAVLTGESAPASKTADAVHTGPIVDSSVDLPSCAFMGTVVHQGTGRGVVVVATGSATAFGKIALGLEEEPAETAFQAGLRKFSKLLVAVAAVLTVSIFVINIVFSRPLLDALLFSLAIAIGITPQLLPAIVSVSLASGARGLAKRRVLVKRLVTIEDLGNIELLFTDKTGTLTEGAITFDQALDPAGCRTAHLLALGLLCNEVTMTVAGPVGGERVGRGVVVRHGDSRAQRYRRRSLRVQTSWAPSVRPRPSTLVCARPTRRRAGAHHHEGFARSRPGPLRRCSDIGTGPPRPSVRRRRTRRRGCDPRGSGAHDGMRA